MSLLLKICGLRAQDDVDAARDAHWGGFIFHPSSPRAVTAEEVARLQSPGLKRVGVFVHQGADEILHTVEQARLDLVQLHGDQDRACALTLSHALGAERIIRVLWPSRYPTLATLEEAMRREADSTGFFLLDAGNSGGGSGQALDWTALHELHSPRPWLLAGGLNPDNAREAAQACSPDGLDFNSGLESSPGRKDPHIIQAALAALRGLL